MEKIKVAIIGWGNVGRFCKQAVERAPDMQLVGVVRRPQSIGKDIAELEGLSVVTDVGELGAVDVALVSIPSREAPDKVKEMILKGIPTVDSFDVHDQILATKKALNQLAVQHRTVSIFGAGWDPGTDSAVRTILKVIAPVGKTTTTFGGTTGGRSMGHTAAVKAIAGVKDAVSLTLPNGAGRHKRQVYIELMPDADFEKITAQIRQDPYFIHDATDVVAVENVRRFDTMNHGGRLERLTQDIQQMYTIEGINPMMTANVMVASARAAYRAQLAGQFGAFTFIERPLIDFLPGSFEERLEGY